MNEKGKNRCFIMVLSRQIQFGDCNVRWLWPLNVSPNSHDFPSTGRSLQQNINMLSDHAEIPLCTVIEIIKYLFQSPSLDFSVIIEVNEDKFATKQMSYTLQTHKQIYNFDKCILKSPSVTVFVKINQFRLTIFSGQFIFGIFSSSSSFQAIF